MRARWKTGKTRLW